MTLEELQNILFDILCEIDTACQKENVHYFLVGGTAIGAVRHHDIIPWDDDIDIAIWVQDYPALETALCKYLPDHLSLVKPTAILPKFYDFVIRVEDTRYYLHRPTDIDKNYGNLQNHPFVDIFLLGNCGNTTLQRALFTFKQSFIYALARGHRIMDNNLKCGFISKLFIRFSEIIGKLVPMKNILNWQEQLYIDSIKEMEWCTFLNGIPTNFGLHFPSKWHKDRIYIQMRNRQLPVFSQYHEHLTACYGDYMNPPEDRSVYIQHFSEDLV